MGSSTFVSPVLLFWLLLSPVEALPQPASPPLSPVPPQAAVLSTIMLASKHTNIFCIVFFIAFSFFYNILFFQNNC
jgi:hypothetical protein